MNAQHVVALFHIISLSMGIVALTVLILALNVFKTAVFRNFLYFHLSYLLHIIMLTIEIYFYTNLFTNTVSPYLFFFDKLPHAFSAAMVCVTFSLFLISYYNLSVKPLTKYIIFFPLQAYIIFITLVCICFSSWYKRIDATVYYTTSCMFWYAGITIWFIHLYMVHRKNMTKKKLRSFTQFLIVFNILIICKEFIDGFTSQHFTHMPQNTAIHIADIVLYTAFCLATIIYCWNFIKTRVIKLDHTLLAVNYGLTLREKEILLYIAEGYTNIQIAEILEISGSTVRNHITHILKKTKTSSKYQLLKLLK